MIEKKNFFLAPPSADRCQVCATWHSEELPHNRDSLYYQMRFQKDQGRWPTWDDAMEHCSEETKAAWRGELALLEKKDV